MNLVNIPEIKTYINNLLMPLHELYYHQYEHSIDVMERATDLAKKEGLGDEEIEILQIAALFHDTGYIIQYENNEAIGAKIAENYLKSRMYPDEKIEKIQDIIMATVPSSKPKNILEQIIKDADLDNLGRQDFFEKGERMKKELETIKKIKIKDKNWKHASLELIENHKFYTKTAKEERELLQQENTEKLKNKY